MNQYLIFEKKRRAKEKHFFAKAIGILTAPPPKLGTSAKQKKRFNSGIARISQPPPHPPIRATLPAIDETFSLSKKRAQKNSGKGNPPPIRAMPELKRFFCFALVPNVTLAFVDGLPT